jgi:putative DNA primase/helicase
MLDLFDEVNTDEEYAKRALNKILKSIMFRGKEEWKLIHDGLNKDMVGDKISPKNCYIIGVIDIIKEYYSKLSCSFATDGNSIYIYNGEYWIKVSEDLIKSFLSKVAHNSGVPNGYTKYWDFINNLFKQLQHSGFYEKMLQSNITYLNLKNGTLKIDVNGVELIKFNPKHFLTHQLDFEYNKSKVNKQWLDFLDTVLDKDTQKTLQQSIGYLFIRDLKLELAFFLYGTGANGKSVIFEIIKGLLNSDMMTNYSLVHLTNKLGYQVADLNNKLINYGSDISMKNVDIAVFKQLVTGEPIGTRQIREKAFTMTNYAKLIFNVNKLDDADIENSNGFFRRMLFIPFDVTIQRDKQDKKLHKKILEDKAGIINWIVDGILEVVANEEIYISPKCENFLDNFKKEASPIQLFIHNFGLVKTDIDTNEIIDFQKMYEMYKEFCKEQGEKIISQRNLNADLKRLGFENVRRKQGNVWFVKVVNS